MNIDNVSENDVLEMAKVRGLILALDHYGLDGLANHVNERWVPRSWFEDEQRDHRKARLALTVLNSEGDLTCWCKDKHADDPDFHMPHCRAVRAILEIDSDEDPR